jgi:site-specific DNA-cytosine methylase
MSFARICKHYRPDFVVMENVPEVLTGKYREYFRAATDELESAGYNLTVDICRAPQSMDLDYLIILNRSHFYRVR